MEAPRDDEQPDASQACADRVWSDFLAMLDALPPTTRLVFLMHDIFGASWPDIERMTGVPGEACRRHLEDARHCIQGCTQARNAPTKAPSTYRGDASC